MVGQYETASRYHRLLRLLDEECDAFDFILFFVFFIICIEKIWRDNKQKVVVFKHIAKNVLILRIN